MKTKSAQHTPGPWKVDSAEQHAMGGERIFKVCSDRPYGGIIADVSAWWVDTQSAQANARLIAAAPELLEALKLTLAVVDKLPNGHSAERVTSAIKAKQAIAKAKGDIKNGKSC